MSQSENLGAPALPSFTDRRRPAALAVSAALLAAGGLWMPIDPAGWFSATPGTAIRAQIRSRGPLTRPSLDLGRRRRRRGDRHHAPGQAGRQAGSGGARGWRRRARGGGGAHGAPYEAGRASRRDQGPARRNLSALRVTFDSNILVYAADADGGEKHSIAADLVARAAHGDCVLTLQSLAEFFFVATTKAMLDAATAAAFVDDWRAVYPVVAAGEGALAGAMAAVLSHRLSFWDAMIWATARQADCHVLVSEDLQDGRMLEGVRFVNPFAPRNAALIETVLPQAPRS